MGQGWRCRNIIDPRALGISAPQPTLGHLLGQRKRWIKGACRLPYQLGALFGSYDAFYTVLGWPGLLPLGTSGLLYAGKVLRRSLFLALTLRQAGHRKRLGGLLLYDVYLLLMFLAVLAYTVWPGTIERKARHYTWAEG